MSLDAFDKGKFHCTFKDMVSKMAVSSTSACRTTAVYLEASIVENAKASFLLNAGLRIKSNPQSNIICENSWNVCVQV